jgi:cytochrome P450
MTAKPGLGANVTLDQLAADPHPVIHRLRSEEPVSWLPAMNAWLVTAYDTCVQVLLDPETFTVDDPRFSTQQVIGPSMLSLDGASHARHRDPFAEPFRAARVRKMAEFIRLTATRLIDEASLLESEDLRAAVAAPLSVAVMAEALDLGDVAVSDLLGWYHEIVDAVHAVTAGHDVPESGRRAFADLQDAVARNLDMSDLLRPVNAAGDLSVEEIVSNVAVLLFGGIVTSESSTAIAFRYLVDDPDLFQTVAADRSLLRGFVEEVFRLEPSASVVDRYATRDVQLGGATIAEGELVRVSLSGANRDPLVFQDPDRLEVSRANAGKSLTFARGPHACLGIHLARLEAVTAVDAFLDRGRPEPVGELLPVSGLVFRVPETVAVIWA